MKNALLVWSSILVGLQILAGGAVLGDVVGPQTAGLFVLIVAALQGATRFYEQSQVTANTEVVAQLAPSGFGVVAGPASLEPNGTPLNVAPKLL
jgi:hypothetical protein